MNPSPHYVKLQSLESYAYIHAQQVKRALQQLLDTISSDAASSLNWPEVDSASQGTYDRAEALLQLEMHGRVYMLMCWDKQPEEETLCLSKREGEVVRLVAQGLPNKSIAEALQISIWTVATYIRRIFNKLGVNSRAEMVARALNKGLLNAGDLQAG